MKTIVTVGLCAALLAGYSLQAARAASPINEVIVLETRGIAALSDEKLIAAYVDVLADLEAIRTFHATSGFAPKEYQKYKALIKSRIELVIEISRRKLELPPSLL